ncbi:tetratricopeptide repeat protein [Emcibacteraceae bacterium]|nr:tetratricopeptide repeat protein [Emcibacteraceae bacterium]
MLNRNFTSLILIVISLLVMPISAVWSQETKEVIAQRLDLAIKYITPLAEAGEKEAQFHLARLLRQPSKQAWDKSYEWLKASAAQNHCGAILAIGDLYFLGRKPFKRDREKGMDFYQKGAELDCTSSMVALGEVYRQGRGVKKNHELANSWYLQAAELGDHSAALYLGRQIANGRGEKKLGRSILLGNHSC